METQATGGFFLNVSRKKLKDQTLNNHPDNSGKKEVCLICIECALAVNFKS